MLAGSVGSRGAGENGGILSSPWLCTVGSGGEGQLLLMLTDVLS